MTDKVNEQESAGQSETTVELSKEKAVSRVLLGAEKFVGQGTEAHVGIAINVSSNKNQLSTLMIPDATTISEGPVYITGPVTITGENLKAFLTKQKVTLPGNLGTLIEDTSISCEAFYYTKTGPLLIMFVLKFDKGVLTSLLGGEIGDLFDIKGASLRVLRCPDNDSFEVLKKYSAGLSA